MVHPVRMTAGMATPSALRHGSVALALLAWPVGVSVRQPIAYQVVGIDHERGGGKGTDKCGLRLAHEWAVCVRGWERVGGMERRGEC